MCKNRIHWDGIEPLLVESLITFIQDTVAIQVNADEVIDSKRRLYGIENPIAVPINRGNQNLFRRRRLHISHPATNASIPNCRELSRKLLVRRHFDSKWKYVTRSIRNVQDGWSCRGKQLVIIVVLGQEKRRTVVRQVTILIAINIDLVDVVLKVVELRHQGVTEFRQQNGLARSFPVKSVDHELEAGVGAISQVDELVGHASPLGLRINDRTGSACMHPRHPTASCRPIDHSERQGIVGRSLKWMGVLHVREAIVVVIGVERIADAIAISVGPLQGVLREGIKGVVHPIPIGVAVVGVTYSVSISVEPVTGIKRQCVNEVKCPIVVVV